MPPLSSDKVLSCLTVVMFAAHRTIKAQVEPLTSQISEKMETDIKPMVNQLQQQLTDLLQRLRDQTAALN